MQKGKNCAQIVLGRFSETYGLDRETALRIASPFGSGRFQGDTCGCIAGGTLVLGLAFGTKDDAFQAKKQLEFERRFADRCGATVCRDLLGHDLSQDVALEAAMADGSIQRICPGCMSAAIEILEEML